MLFEGSASSSLMDLFNMIVLFCGVYCFFAWYKMRDGKIPERFPLLNKEYDPKKCLDEDYYVSYVRPRLLIFAILITVFGLFSVLDTQFDISAKLFPEAAVAVSVIVGSFLPFVIIVWFAACLHKIQKELWV